MVKKDVIIFFQVFVILIIILSLGVYSACVYPWTGESIPCSGEETTEPPPEDSSVDYLQDKITEDISNSGSVDFSKDPYAGNPEDTIKALNKLYPNLDISSVSGVKINGDTLTTADNSKIDLTTGKSITVETDGSKVTYFDDGEGTTCLNCEGLTYTSDGFKVGSGEKID